MGSENVISTNVTTTMAFMADENITDYYTAGLENITDYYTAGLENITDYYTAGLEEITENYTTGLQNITDNYTTGLQNITTNLTTTMASILEPKYPIWVVVIFAALAGITSITAILGNLLVIIAFVVERQIRQPSNYFICSLAVTDLIIGLFSMPLYTMYDLLGYWPLGPWICDLWLSLDYTVCLTSQYTVFFITLDRYCLVKIPAKYHNWRTDRKIFILISITWLVPTLVFFVTIIGWQFYEGKRTVDSNHCYVQFITNPMFNCILVIGYYWVTLVVICALYGQIYHVAWSLQKKSEAKHKKMTNIVKDMTNFDVGMTECVHNSNHTASITSLTTSFSSEEQSGSAAGKIKVEEPTVNQANKVWKRQQDKPKRSKSENLARKALRKITLILGAFVFFWTPYHVCVLIIGFCPQGVECVPAVIYSVTYWFCYCNSPLNPFCYAAANQQFKKTFMRILKGDFHRT